MTLRTGFSAATIPIEEKIRNVQEGALELNNGAKVS
jgi:hypothetical protein